MLRRRRKKSEKEISTSKQNKAQKKLKCKQEESSESGKTDSDYAEFLKTYDPKEETGSDEEVTQKLPRIKKSKRKDSKLPESVQDSNSLE
ncbi:hypothetical protein A2U01_0007555 [Trifolium medium]|uniref:Uncharacterized protein n=1 Tax=Trifolium medium TaxID=97028 RepID=A0A392MHY8_9FABA|nr:hypothetical protein [Trifolium medium]